MRKFVEVIEFIKAIAIGYMISDVLLHVATGVLW